MGELLVGAFLYIYAKNERPEYDPNEHRMMTECEMIEKMRKFSVLIAYICGNPA